ncbi:MAG: FAD-dependent oxidoreductase [Proteobacteria bacterium]|nr:FAD-dependent oxidoreductase [Pseudomonadota bacterium]MBU1389019.1 FAD-dependent oxidoreductase [Pseudomonadota bacterium]MBU1543571.1 FAD-dependent oxidoreductase [Pseudomonadota bacterium]MBU2429645.1 FAD-dependent oxidoreductase [Pseudomonadota bacterium]MBU2481431.1 FAD-dependent oxidoreductase [Pseudomonadota bacterium]
MFNNLMSPIKINNLTIKNRTAYPSLGVLFSMDKKLNDRYYNFFKEIAHGGAGIVTVGPVGVDFIGSGFFTLGIEKDEYIPSFQKLTGIIKQAGASPWIQLFHAGAYSHPMMINNLTPKAPSKIYSNYSRTEPEEMTIKEIKEIQTAFVQAAARAKDAGFEGVEIIASAGYLITQFLSPLKNKRTDEYGGSFENRVRFPDEIIRMMRQSLGDDYPLGIRMAGNDLVDQSNTDSEMPAIAKVYEACGIDVINVTGGWHESKIPQLPMELPRGTFAYFAQNIKKAVSIPVMASNRITTPYEAENIIKDGFADMVNLGRVLIADPQWPNKAKAGKPEEIRPCVGCNQGCTDQIFSGSPVFCLGNPQAGFEGERILTKVDSPKKVLVVGAGVGGLEAAITAKRKGHHVEIYEKDNEIGGQLWLAGAPPHKQELLEFIRYYRAMLKKYNIDVIFNTKVTAQLIKEKNPDHVIVAEGAEPLVPPIEGVDSPCVYTSWDILKDNPPLGKKVAVIGGGAVGLETAHFIASKGSMSPEVLHFLFRYEAVSDKKLREYVFTGTSKVTVFEMLARTGAGVGKSTRWVLFGNLEKYGVKSYTSAKVLSVKKGLVKYESGNEIKQEQFDNVVIASGSKSVKTISQEIETLGIPFSVIGDGAAPRQLNDAIHGGFLAALNI